MPSRRSSRLALLRRTVALAAATAAAFPALAHAGDVAFAGGVYVGFVFGDQIGVGYGADASMMGLVTGGVDECGPRSGLGGLFQIGGINGSTLRMVAAAQGGATADDEASPGIVGELGLAGHVAAEEPGVGIHTGLLLDTGRFANFFVRGEWLLDEYSVGGGARFLGTFGLPGCADIGRPLRNADGLPVRVDPAGIDASGTGEHGPIARAWAADAQAECASIPAFLQLAIDLLASGAPDALVAAALDAAEDEIRHARACAAMASRWLEAPFRPTLPGEPFRAATIGSALVARLAVESWLDGALNEGAAAARASAAARSATDGPSARLQRRIASDEARHAELGWQVLAWALRRGGPEIREQVRCLREVELPSTAAPRVASRLGAAFGQLEASRGEAVSTRHAERARRRLDRVLAA